MEKSNEVKFDLAYEYASFSTDYDSVINKTLVSSKILDNPSKDIFLLVNNFKYMGNQAQKIYRAYEIFSNMIKSKDKIVLSFATNIALSNKAYINFLIKNKLIGCVVTTCGAFEEDIINDLYKSHFLVEKDVWSEGSMNDDIKLKTFGINRAGDMLSSNKNYVKLWTEIGEKLKDKNFDSSTSFSEFFRYIISNLPLSNSSIFKLLSDQNIPFFIPAPTDGAVGDFIFFQKRFFNKDYNLSLSKDYIEMAEWYIKYQDIISLIVLGAGTSKHHALLHSIYARGAKKAIYINTSLDIDNSDSGGSPSEAITWGKIDKQGEFVKIFAEVSTCFPLIVEAIRYEFNIS